MFLFLKYVFIFSYIYVCFVLKNIFGMITPLLFCWYNMYLSVLTRLAEPCQDYSFLPGIVHLTYNFYLTIITSSYHNLGHLDRGDIVYFVFNNRNHWNQSIIKNDHESCLSDALKLGLTCLNTRRKLITLDRWHLT